MANTHFTEVEARRDARRYLEAEMNYGQGSRIARRNIQMEISRKIKNPEYKVIFDDEYAKLDRDNTFQKLQMKKKAQEAYSASKKMMRLFRKVQRLAKDNRYIFEKILEVFE